MANDILKITPPGLSDRFKQLLQSSNIVYSNYTDTAIEIVKSIWDTSYKLPENIITVVSDLFGFEISDLLFFDTDTRIKIKNLFINNIITFYRNRIKESIYQILLYIYGLHGNVNILNTKDWVNFFIGELTYYDRNLYTDVGLTTDAGYFTDNLIRTPFIQIQILLDKLYPDNYLWFQNINTNFKSDVNNIRYILTKVFYQLALYAVGTANQTTTDPNTGVETICGNITNLANINKYRVTFQNNTTYTDFILSKEVGDGYFEYDINYTVPSDSTIIKVELLNLKEDTVYVTINSPYIYIQRGDSFYCNVVVNSSISNIPYDLAVWNLFFVNNTTFDKNLRITRSFWG